MTHDQGINFIIKLGGFIQFLIENGYIKDKSNFQEHRFGTIDFSNCTKSK